MVSQEKKYFLLILISAVLLSALIPYGIHIYSHVSVRMEFANEQSQAIRILQNLQQRKSPVTRRDRAWNNAVEHVIGGVNNALFSVESVPLDEMKKYRKELAAKFVHNPEPSLEDLEWAWYRLREASPQAARHIDRFQSQFEESIQEARRNKSEE